MRNSLRFLIVMLCVCCVTDVARAAEPKEPSVEPTRPSVQEAETAHATKGDSAVPATASQTPASHEAKANDERERPVKKREPIKIVDLSPELATHIEVDPLPTEFKRLTTFRLKRDGVLVVADGVEKKVRFLTADGADISGIQLDFAPEALNLADDDSIYCGGQGKLALINPQGCIVKTITVPDSVAPTPAELKAAQEVQIEEPKEPEHRPATGPSAKRRKRSRPKQISGIAVSDHDVFVAFGSGWSTGSKSKLFRFDRQLENPVQLAEGLRGCCQRCDIAIRNGVLYLAENAAHRVVLCDRDGIVLNKWGEQGRDTLETFGACCNPMNLCLASDGTIYTSESGLGRIKRYSADGRFLELVGYVGTGRFWHGSSFAASCSNIAIAVTGDGERVYVQDYRENKIRVLQKKAAMQEAAE